MAPELIQLNELARVIFAECDAVLDVLRGPCCVERAIRPWRGKRQAGEAFRAADYRGNAKLKIKKVKLPAARQHRPARYGRLEARAGEVPLKDFLLSERARTGVSRDTVYERLMSGVYPGVALRRVNSRRVFVRVNHLPPADPYAPLPGEICLKEFVALEAERLGLNEHAVYVRVLRGKYAGLQMRRLNRRVVFVRANLTAENAKNAERNQVKL